MRRILARVWREILSVLAEPNRRLVKQLLAERAAQRLYRRLLMGVQPGKSLQRTMNLRRAQQFRSGSKAPNPRHGPSFTLPVAEVLGPLSDILLRGASRSCPGMSIQFTDMIDVVHVV